MIDVNEFAVSLPAIVDRVRAGEVITIADQGIPILRLVPIGSQPDVLDEMVAAGTATPPAEDGMPEMIADLLPDVPSLADLLIEERNRERDS